MAEAYTRRPIQLAAEIHSRCKHLRNVSDRISIHLPDDCDIMEEPVENRVALRAWDQMHNIDAKGTVEWYTVVD